MIDLEEFTPFEREKITNEVKDHGEWVTAYSIYFSPLFRMLVDLQETDTDIVWLTASIHLVNFLVTKDPSPIHYTIVRNLLEENGISDADAVDLLARELVMQCQRFQEHVMEVFSDKEKSFVAIPFCQQEGFFLPSRDYLPNFVCENNGHNALDLIFCEFLKLFGETGKRAAIAIKKASRENFKNFKDSGYKSSERPKVWSFWARKNEKNPVFSPHLKILADVIWKDVVVQQFQKKKKQLPALTQSVSRPLNQFLSSKAETMTNKNGNIIVSHNGKVVADADIAAMDRKLNQLIIKGSGSFNSIYHHKLLRYECKAGFENWASGIADARVLKFEGGETQIAEILGIKHKDAPSKIKALLHAQAHMTFYFADGSRGNLISLSQYKSRRTNRDEGIEIVLGTQLIPHYTFQTDRRSNLLVPVPDLPPFVSSSQYYAGQALLQMLIMEKFSSDSIDLASIGSVEIPEELWGEFSFQTGLPSSVMAKVRDRWVHDGDDGGRFLIKVRKNRYTLGKEYSKELRFLTLQGEHRKDQAARGKISAKKRKK